MNSITLNEEIISLPFTLLFALVNELYFMEPNFFDLMIHLTELVKFLLKCHQTFYAVVYLMYLQCK